jgi:hypothetical protein
MDSKIEIVVFSHIPGKVESIECEGYKISSLCNAIHVNAYAKGVKIAVIPWNRVKQINIK